ncbi:MAG: IS1380 family transposase [Armatimonadetes bacterium]|nr:IS1380 family transposase [Armatimonadota bacterium]
MSRTRLSLYSSYYIDTKVEPAAVTNYGGLFPYLDLMLLTELPTVIGECLPEQSLRGWRHAEHIAALLALNLTGGDCVDDLSKLSEDPGVGLYMRQIARSVGAKGRRFSRGGENDVPSVTCVREWLEQFHNAEEDVKRGYGQAFVPEANESLSGIRRVNREFVKRGWELHKRSGRPEVSRATLEIDATFMETQKRGALACYKHFDAYSSLTVRWAEMGLAIWDEFRDGNVPPAYRNAEALTESIRYLNDELGITDVWVRSDAAAHQESVLKELSEWKIDGKASPVRFAIGYIKTKEFRKALQKLGKKEWQPVFDKKGRLDYEVAEVPFVSNSEALIKSEPYRHIVVRRKARQGILPGLGLSDAKLSDEETVEMGGQAYHVHAIISNIVEDWSSRQVVEWYNGRCGGGEAIHSILKSDLAGGSLPSNRFGVNAAWWAVAVLAHNLHALLEKLAMPKDLVGSRFKRLRFHLINVPARLVNHARACCMRYFQAAALYLVRHIRGELAKLGPAFG